MQQRVKIVLAATAAALSLTVGLSLGQAPAQPGANGAPPQAQGKGGGKGGGKAKGPSRPTPHWPDGRVNLGPLAGETGMWMGNAGATIARNPGGRGLDNPATNHPSNLNVADVPFLPWARALYEFRQATLTKDDPHVRCKPSGGPRMYHTPYGMEFVDMPELQRIYVYGVGGPHTYRTIYMDGRGHPKDFDPSFQGHSTGKWEGDTLAVETVGFNERFWLTREGIPSTTALKLTERFTRTDYDHLDYLATIDDPETYTKPWSGGWVINWGAGEMYEYVCQDNNRDIRHMYGGE